MLAKTKLVFVVMLLLISIHFFSFLISFDLFDKLEFLRMHAIQFVMRSKYVTELTDNFKNDK